MAVSYTRLDPHDNQGFVLAVNTALAPTPAPSYPLTVKSRDPKISGKFYIEINLSDAGTGFEPASGFGVAMLGASFVNLGAPVNPFGGALGGALVYANGDVSINAHTTTGVFAAFGSGTVISVAADLDDAAIWFRVNGGAWNGSGANDPSSNVGGFSLAALTGNMVLAITNPGGNANFAAQLIADPAGFSYPHSLPVGFTPGWPDNEYPDPAVAGVNGLGASKLTALAPIAAPGVAVRKMTAEAAIGAPGAAVRKLTASGLLMPPGIAVRKLTVYAFLFSLDFGPGGPTSMPPPLYPELIGLTYTVTKRPIWSTGSSRAGSGRTIRVGYYSVNLWEFELKYDFLPDRVGGTTANDLKALEGFFLLPAISGGLGGFLFDDADDDTVAGQIVGTTDGVNTTWTIVRQFATGSALEPVGMVDTTRTVTVYLDGVPQSSASYDIVTSAPVNQQLRFHAAPSTGQVVTMDFSFFFYVRFQDDKLDFVKFVEKLWQQDKIVLESLRG